MKIQSIEVFKLDIPVKDPMIVTFLNATWKHARNVVVRIASDTDSAWPCESTVSLASPSCPIRLRRMSR